MLILLTLREVGSLRQNTSTRTWYSSCSASLLFKASPTFQVPLRIHSEKPFSISLSPLSQSLLFGLSDMLKKRFLARKGCRIPPFSILIIVVLKFFYLESAPSEIAQFELFVYMSLLLEFIYLYCKYFASL